jgi:dCTP deaminase
MSFLSGTQLETVLEKSLGEFYRKSRISQAAYQLSLGNQVFRTDSENKKREILDDKDSQIIINPGQFALLLTEETIRMPNDYLAFISIKFQQKIKGLVNVSGFHIDPGFEGKIIFSVYNAGPSPILMDKGKPYFLLWLTPLTEAVTYKGNHQGQDEISAELIEKLKGDIASPNSLLTNIQDVEKRLTERTDKLKGQKNYLTWLYQALIVVFAGLFINECRKNDQLSIAYETGFRDAEQKIQFGKDVTLYIDSLENVIHKIKPVEKRKDTIKRNQAYEN